MAGGGLSGRSDPPSGAAGGVRAHPAGRGLQGDQGYLSLLDGLREVVFQTDPQGNWTFLNRAWSEITGFPVADSLGTNFLDYVHPDERDDTIELFKAVVEGGADYCLHETRYRRADGGYTWIELRSRLLFDSTGRPIGNTGTIIDISLRRRAEELLSDQTGVLELIANGAPLEKTLAAIAELIERHTGGRAEITLEPGEALRHRSRRSDNGDAARTVGGELRYLRTGENWPVRFSVPIWSVTTATRLGAFAIVHDSPRRVDSAQRQLVERCTQLAAIAIERQLQEDEVRRQALQDPLTGLANRALIDGRLQQAIAGARRHDHRVALLLLDLDRFKDINDTLGHEAGDEVLKVVARRVQSALRENDTVGRLGGDEFALILPEVSAEQAEYVTRKVLRAVQRPFDLRGAMLHLDASVGISLFPVHGNDHATLLRRADVAMYRAKKVGSGLAVYDPAHDEERLVLLGLAAELRQAIEGDELTLHYQPKVELRSGRVVGVEALVRWRHPTRGLVPPDQFVPLAERTGLIKPLSLWVLRRAVAESARWRDERGIGLAINLSTHMLHDGRLYESVGDVLREGGMPASQLELEITESAVMADADSALDAIASLRETGVVFAIDDYGTGYSSLAYLKQLPVRWLKIDKSFVRDMGTDERDASIVRSAIELAHNLGMGVVAEGVESRGVCELLRRLGCDYAQGYHLARPMSATDLHGWLAAREAVKV